jgi:hypothetical protein
LWRGRSIPAVPQYKPSISENASANCFQLRTLSPARPGISMVEQAETTILIVILTSDFGFGCSSSVHVATMILYSLKMTIMGI